MSGKARCLVCSLPVMPYSGEGEAPLLTLGVFAHSQRSQVCPEHMKANYLEDDAGHRIRFCL